MLKKRGHRAAHLAVGTGSLPKKLRMPQEITKSPSPQGLGDFFLLLTAAAAATAAVASTALSVRATNTLGAVFLCLIDIVGSAA